MIGLTRPAIILAAAAALVVGTVPAVGATASPAAVVPDDWVVLEDDTGLLTVAVPPEWTDTVTSPTDDGTAQPRIAAATDVDTFVDTFDAPGVVLIAMPYDPDTPGVAADALTSGCRSAEDQRYDDGAFVGVLRHWTACGFGDNEDAEVFIVAAAPVNLSVTLTLLIQVTGPEQRDIVDGVLASFNLTHLPDPPAPTTATTTTATTTVTTAATTTVTTAATTTVTTAATPVQPTTGPATTAQATTPTTVQPTTTVQRTTTAPATTAAGGPATSDEPQRVRDDSGALEVDVPASWTDVNLRPATRPGGVELPSIAASLDLDAFLPSGDDEFLTPGVIYRGLPYDADTEAALDDVGRLGCVDGGVTPYSDSLFTGHMRTFPSCSGTATRQFIVVANPNDASFTALLVIRLTEPGDRELSTILGSFTYDPSAVGSAPTATS